MQKIKIRKSRSLLEEDEMKDQVRQAILQPYNVSMYYDQSTLCARIAMSTQGSRQVTLYDTFSFFPVGNRAGGTKFTIQSRALLGP